MIVIISFSYSTPMTTSFWFYRKTAVPFVENLRNIFNTWLSMDPMVWYRMILWTQMMSQARDTESVTNYLALSEVSK